MKTNFATRAGGKTLRIDEKFLIKKNENFKIFRKIYGMYIKTKQKTRRIQIPVQKVWFWKKNQFFDVFQFFFLGVAASKFNFSIFQDFKNFFWKMTLMGPLECWKKQCHEKWAYLGHPLKSHARSSTCACGFHPPHVV